MLPAKPFYLLRHGESEANAACITAGGQYNSPLTMKGIGQAEALAAVIDQLEVKPQIIYNSYMARSLRTAEIVNTGLKIEMDSRYDYALRERDCGEYDGMPWDCEMVARMESGEKPPNGESGPEFMQRIQYTFTEIMNREVNRLPLIVSHGGHFHAMGLIYEYGMSHVQNCHLHYFEPYPSFDLFPWRVWCFDVEGNRLVKRSAPFCLSQALDKIA